ncbi:hypothetical protein Clacol_006435 [Clathrus columnatus]|uniref:Cytochrome b561 domain-containing protein n=1 Tax=Clathrus columnatus TaxID=1419009 RepID=A0AAV5AC32_9AGAM|nr:hypothetical protein Clacol_006435 [Clathrus columnatus]
MSYNIAAFNQEVRLHATLAPIAMVVLLPIGILIPRFLRTTKIKWFWIHALWQTLVLGPVLIVGIGYGIKATDRQVKASSTSHFNDPHKKSGLAILILYFVQVMLGLFSHFANTNPIPGVYRSPQRILHILLGLTLFGLGFWQVNYGYTIEWVTYVGSIVPLSVNKAWKALVIQIIAETTAAETCLILLEKLLVKHSVLKVEVSLKRHNGISILL